MEIPHLYHPRLYHVCLMLVPSPKTTQGLEFWIKKPQPGSRQGQYFIYIALIFLQSRCEFIGNLALPCHCFLLQLRTLLYCTADLNNIRDA